MKVLLKKFLRSLLLCLLCSSVLHAEWVSMREFRQYTFTGSLARLNDQWVSWGVGYIFVSDDAVHWTAIDVPHHWGMSEVFYGNGIWVVPNYDQFHRMSFSNDLKTWREINFLDEDDFVNVVGFSNGFFWGQGNHPHDWFRSLDGVSWTKIRNPFRQEVVETTVTGETISESDLDLDWKSEWIHEGNVTILRNVAWRKGTPGNIAYTVDGVNWQVIRLELKDGSVWTTDALDLASFYTVLNFTQGGKLFRGALYRAQGESVVRTDSQGNETEFKLFELTGLEALKYDDIIQLFASETRLYAGTASGKIFQTYDGINWGVRLNQPKMFAEEFFNNEDDILVQSTFGNRYRLASNASSMELISKPTSISAEMGILEINHAWYGANGEGIVKSENGVDWDWVLDVETQAGDFSGDNTFISDLAYADTQWVAYGSSQTGSSWDDDNVVQRIVWTSDDAENWQVATVMLGDEPMTLWSERFVYGNQVWVGLLIDEFERSVVTSADGIHFQKTSYTDSWFTNSRVVFFNGVFVLAGEKQYLYSEDGVNWTEGALDGPLPDEYYFHSTYFYSTQKRLLAFNGWDLWESEDGKTWSHLPNPLENPAGFYGEDARFFTVGDELLYSNSWQMFLLQDGTTWVSDSRFPGDLKEILHHPQTGDVWLFNGNFLADESVLELPRVTIKQVNGYEFFEGQTDIPAFSVKRTGDISLPLDVYLQETSSGEYGVDHVHNVGWEGDHLLLHFEPGYSELHIRITAFSDGREDSTSVGFEILASPQYDISDLYQAHSYVIIYDPE